MQRVTTHTNSIRYKTRTFTFYILERNMVPAHDRFVRWLARDAHRHAGGHTSTRLLGRKDTVIGGRFIAIAIY
jgi:hypothetical protein